VKKAKDFHGILSLIKKAFRNIAIKAIQTEDKKCFFE